MKRVKPWMIAGCALLAISVDAAAEEANCPLDQLDQVNFAVEGECKGESCPACAKSKEGKFLAISDSSCSTDQCKSCSEGQVAQITLPKIEEIQPVEQLAGLLNGEAIGNALGFSFRLLADTECSGRCSDSAAVKQVDIDFTSPCKSCGNTSQTVAFGSTACTESGCTNSVKPASAELKKVAAEDFGNLAWQKLAWSLLNERNAVVHKLFEVVQEKSEERVRTIHETYATIAELRDELSNVQLQRVQELAELRIEHAEEIAALRTEFQEELMALRTANQELQHKLASSQDERAARLARNPYNEKE